SRPTVRNRRATESRKSGSSSTSKTLGSPMPGTRLKRSPFFLLEKPSFYAQSVDSEQRLLPNRIVEPLSHRLGASALLCCELSQTLQYRMQTRGIGACTWGGRCLEVNVEPATDIDRR